MSCRLEKYVPQKKYMSGERPGSRCRPVSGLLPSWRWSPGEREDSLRRGRGLSPYLPPHLYHLLVVAARIISLSPRLPVASHYGRHSRRIVRCRLSRHWDMGGGECLQIFRVQIEHLANCQCTSLFAYGTLRSVALLVSGLSRAWMTRYLRTLKRCRWRIVLSVS